MVLVIVAVSNKVDVVDSRAVVRISSADVRVLVVVVSKNWVVVMVVSALTASVSVLYTVVLNTAVETTFVVWSNPDVVVLVTVIYSREPSVSE